MTATIPVGYILHTVRHICRHCAGLQTHDALTAIGSSYTLGESDLMYDLPYTRITHTIYTIRCSNCIDWEKAKPPARPVRVERATSEVSLATLLDY